MLIRAFKWAAKIYLNVKVNTFSFINSNMCKTTDTK